jgi:hypothetical protein
MDTKAIIAPRPAAFALLATLCAAAAHAQSPESDVETGTAAPPEPAEGYLVPDARPQWLGNLSNVRYARRMPVPRRHGEVELVARVGRVDLDDGAVSGGTLDKWYVGANWWATKRWKASLGYGDADLDRFGLVGNTKLLLARLQWIY